jgi:branched-chain amino acid aminotransferase
MTKVAVPHALQTPEFLFCRGAVRPWAEGLIHVNSEAVLRGLNIFEGLKGFWRQDGSFGLVTMRRHYDRLHRSARILRMPFEMDFDTYDAACHALVQRLRRPSHDMWLRTTLMLVAGHWGEGDRTDLVITAYDHPRGPAPDMASGVTSWRRANDNALPARVKMGPNYLVARMSKIEGRSRGYREMIVLNDAGRVAEFVGSAVLIVRNGTIATPPASEGAFESITVDLIEILAAEAGVPFVRRPIDRTELSVADEIASCGTLNDLVMLSSIDGSALGPAPILTALRARYLDAVTGVRPHPAIDMSIRATDDAQDALRRYRESAQCFESV